MSDELFYQLGASKVEWGEPDADGFYTPTVYRETPPAGVDLTVDLEGTPTLVGWETRDAD